MIKRTLILLLSLTFIFFLTPKKTVKATVGNVDEDLWITNGSIYSVTTGVDGTTYIGGSFTYVGPPTGNGAVLDYTSASPNLSFPKVDGAIATVISDGSGGWYIGGDFTKVGTETRNRIAHILSNGAVDPNFNPNPNSSVNSVAIIDDTIYIGGAFTTIGGQTRNRIAALDIGGSLTSWDPNANGTVETIAATQDTIYVGGAFTTIGGQTRNRIAALDVGGSATSWDPSASNSVLTITTSQNTIYAGGAFTSIGGQTRNYIAALDIGGSATSWNPSANSWVYTITVSGSTVYTGGAFTTIGGQTRNRIAALDIGGSATSWDPNSSGAINTIAFVEDTIYTGGTFTTIGGQTRNRIAALDIGGSATSWNPNSSGTVETIAATQDTIYVGGSFRSVGGQTRNRIAALDIGGSLTSWDPNANGTVDTVTTTQDTIYVGGSFTSIGGQTRNRIAALDIGGSATSWNPNANDTVLTIAIVDNIVYIGGYFTYIGGQARNSIAALGVGGSLTSWDPNANYAVNAITIMGDTIYAGGEFTSIGGQTRNRIAALDIGGSATSWNPNANGTVNTIAVSGSTIYAGGSFTTIGGQTRNRIAALDIGGSATVWNPNTSASVRSVDIYGSTIYIGGSFTTIGANYRSYLAGITIDVTAPTLTLTPLTYTSSNTPSLTGTATDDSDNISLVEHQVGSTSGSWTSCTASDDNFNNIEEDFTCTVNPSLLDGQHTIYFRATDRYGNLTNSGSESSQTITVDTSPPDINSPLVATTDSSATISWITSESSNSIVSYGLTSSLGTTTPVTDISTNHTIVLDSLISCTLYYYQAISIDLASNQTTGNTNTFITSGCGGQGVGSSASSYALSHITNSVGGGLTLASTRSGLNLTLPPSVKHGLGDTAPLDVQIKVLESSSIISSHSVPSDLITSDSNSNGNQLVSSIFDLKLYSDVGTTVSNFDNPVTVTFTFTPEQVNGFDGNTLSIYRHDGTSWNLLDTDRDFTNHTLTASTSAFSLFAIFGQPFNFPTLHTSSSPSSTSTCSDPTPVLAPDLFQINAYSTKALLFFTPLPDTSTFYISFSENPDAEMYGEKVELIKEGVQSHSIYELNPNTTYYLKVRGQIGCMPGPWSTILKFKTNGTKTAPKMYYKYTTKKT